MTSKDHVAVGQTYDHAGDHGYMFTVTAVKRARSGREERWHVTLMCVSTPRSSWLLGRVVNETSTDGTLRAFGYKRLA